MNEQQDAAASLQQAMQEHSQGNLYEADLLYSRALQQDPANLQALRLRAVLARERGDIGLSQRLLQQGLELATDDTALLSELGLSHLAAGELLAAEEQLRAAGEQAPDNATILTNLGAVLQQRGHLREAIDCYERALAAEPDDLYLRCNLAKAHSDAGDAQQALQACKQLGGVDAHPMALATHGAVLIDQENYVEARRLLEQVVASHFPDDMAHVNLALACQALGDSSAAIIALKNALEINPYNARAVSDLANCLCAADEHGGALELCERFLAEHPGERLVIGSYALALHNAGQHEQALELTNSDDLIQVIDLPTAEGFDSIAAFNQQLTEEIRHNPSLLANPVSKSTMGGDQTGELDLHATPAMQALNKMFGRGLEMAASHYSEAGLHQHPAMAGAREPRTLRAWGTVIHAGGQQSAHMHPLAWLSGVYYAHLPTDMTASDSEAGWLEFNHPPERFHRTSPTRTWRIEPREGRLIVFPSWFWHQTIPFESADDRISVAFDAVPIAALRMI